MATPKHRRAALWPAAVRLVKWTHKFHQALSLCLDASIGGASGSMEQAPGVVSAT